MATDEFDPELESKGLREQAQTVRAQSVAARVQAQELRERTLRARLRTRELSRAYAHLIEQFDRQASDTIAGAPSDGELAASVALSRDLRDAVREYAELLREEAMSPERSFTLVKSAVADTIRMRRTDERHVAEALVRWFVAGYYDRPA